MRSLLIWSLACLAAFILPAPARAQSGARADPDAAHWNIELLDTARDAAYLSGIEKDVILEMNKARTDPKKYAALYIRPRLAFFSGRNYVVPGQVILQTQEGAAAVEECIEALNRAERAGILTPERGLSLAARDHVMDQGRTGQTGHTGSDGSTPDSRMERYGAFGGSLAGGGENISYGLTGGREIVSSLLIDDGVPGRGHRTNILNPAYTQTGVEFGTHPHYGSMCTMTYSEGYKSAASSAPSETEADAIFSFSEGGGEGKHKVRAPKGVIEVVLKELDDASFELEGREAKCIEYTLSETGIRKRRKGQEYRLFDVYEIDLNEDGVPDYFVFPSSSADTPCILMFYGAHAISYWFVTTHMNKGRPVYRMAYTGRSDGGWVLPTKTNGYHDLIAWDFALAGAVIYYRTLAYDGQKYVDVKCIVKDSSSHMDYREHPERWKTVVESVECSP